MSRMFAAILIALAMVVPVWGQTITGTTSGTTTIVGSPNPSGTTIIVQPIPKEPGTNCPSDYPIEMEHNGKRWCAALPIDLSGTSDVRLYGDGKAR